MIQWLFKTHLWFTGSRSPSPVSAQCRSRTRTPSPTPSGELCVDIPYQHKDSPTPDRDSLHIEMVASNVDHNNRGRLHIWFEYKPWIKCQSNKKDKLTVGHIKKIVFDAFRLYDLGTLFRCVHLFVYLYVNLQTVTLPLTSDLYKV